MSFQSPPFRLAVKPITLFPVPLYPLHFSPVALIPVTLPLRFLGATLKATRLSHRDVPQQSQP
jgi:hypothetical protein